MRFGIVQASLTLLSAFAIFAEKQSYVMFIVISIMFGGIAIGYLLRRVDLLQKVGKPISYTIYLLLFILGASVGQNDEIVNNLSTLGLQALIISLAATIGSVLAAWGVYHFFFKERRVEDER